MAAILNTVILNSALLDSAILHKTLTQTNSIWLKLIHSHSTWWCQPSWILPSWFQPFWTKKKCTHSLSLNFIMAAILNTAILDSAILHKTLTQTNSFSLNLIMPDIFILPSWIQPVWTKKNFNHLFWLNFIMAAILNSTILDSAILHKNTSLIHSDSSWWLQPSWILPSGGFSHFEQKKNFTHSFWLNLMMSDILNSHSILDSVILNKKKLHSFHSDSTWWWQPSWTLPCVDSDTAILNSDTLLSSLRFT